MHQEIEPGSLRHFHFFKSFTKRFLFHPWQHGFEIYQPQKSLEYNKLYPHYSVLLLRRSPTGLESQEATRFTSQQKKNWMSILQDCK